MSRLGHEINRVWKHTQRNENPEQYQRKDDKQFASTIHYMPKVSWPTFG